MLALCVDDEALLLLELSGAVKASPDITETASFQKCSEAIEWAQTHDPDVAFLDIQLRGMTGLELAEKLTALHPSLHIVFCTGYREYAFDALQLHVSGYLLKPVTKEAVQKEIDHIKTERALMADTSNKLLTVQTFGNFDVFAAGKPLHFKRKRAKELLAYLIDRRGATVTAKEICTVLWEDEYDIQKNLAVLYKLFGDLRETLAEVGAEEVLIRNGYEYAVDTDKLDCDLYRYLSGLEPKSFRGEYMLQYSWAEETTASL